MGKFLYRLKYAKYREVTQPGVKLFSRDEIYQLVAGVESDDDSVTERMVTVQLRQLDSPDTLAVEHTIWAGYLEKVPRPSVQAPRALDHKEG